MAELVFAGGMPITGYVIFADDLSQLYKIWIMLVTTSMVGWHILVVNDAVFPGSSVPRTKLGFAILLPVLSLATTLYLGYQLAAVGLILMMVNWHIYAVYFKGFYATALLCNFLGGLLHFEVGALFLTDDLRATLSCALFFGLLMTGGSMHHDALDYEEDKAADYITGAVRFGQRKWWRLGIIPMTAANLLLAVQWSVLSWFFLPAFTFYVVLYGVYFTEPTTERQLQFRFACRVIYGLAGGSFICFRLAEVIGG